MKFACPDSSSSSSLSYCPSPWIPASSRKHQRPNTPNEKQAGVGMSRPPLRRSRPQLLKN
ncbi:hypothetical protein E2C01_097559 [Portunus trituberculatus]|uniref:Uncharacterized protein n=1 Tax=Portunus trituberculatus TaxID=210409 RepID=A0A5B7KBQ4_PORTR|nr:hypothetical protein [Portunus trituberculatus]